VCEELPRRGGIDGVSFYLLFPISSLGVSYEGKSRTRAPIVLDRRFVVSADHTFFLSLLHGTACLIFLSPGQKPARAS